MSRALSGVRAGARGRGRNRKAPDLARKRGALDGSLQFPCPVAGGIEHHADAEGRLPLVTKRGHHPVCHGERDLSDGHRETSAKAGRGVRGGRDSHCLDGPGSPSEGHARTSRRTDEGLPHRAAGLAHLLRRPHYSAVGGWGSDVDSSSFPSRFHTLRRSVCFSLHLSSGLALTKVRKEGRAQVWPWPVGGGEAGPGPGWTGRGTWLTLLRPAASPGAEVEAANVRLDVNPGEELMLPSQPSTSQGSPHFSAFQTLFSH